jgi:hypothetical protein
MDCQEKLMQAQRELEDTKARLAATEKVLHTVLGVLTPEQWSAARTDLDLQDLLGRGTDSAV